MASLLSNGASQAPFCSGGKSLLSDHPEIHRVLLRPNEASIAADIQMYLDSTLGEGLWSDEQYIELEKGIRVPLIISFRLIFLAYMRVLFSLFGFPSY